MQRSCVATIMHDGVYVSSQAFFTTIISHVTVKTGTIVSSPSLSAATGVFVVLSSPSLSPSGVHVVVDDWWCFEHINDHISRKLGLLQ